MYKESFLVFCWMVTGSWWKTSGADVGRSAEKNKCTKSVILYFIGLWRGRGGSQIGKILAGLLRNINVQRQYYFLLMDQDRVMVEDKWGRCLLDC